MDKIRTGLEILAKIIAQEVYKKKAERKEVKKL